MTLDEIERKAASILTEQWHGQDTIELAEMLLLVLPVVRAADQATDDEGTMPGYLCNAVVRMRKEMKKP